MINKNEITLEMLDKLIKDVKEAHPEWDILDIRQRVWRASRTPKIPKE